MTYLLMVIVTSIIWRRLDYLEKRRAEKQAMFEQWMFRSLYSINNKVLLPNEHEQVESIMTPVVYSPEEDDLLFQFKGSGF